MVAELYFPKWSGLAAAICVETLGLSDIQTEVSIWQWNESANRSDPKVPVFFVVSVEDCGY